MNKSEAKLILQAFHADRHEKDDPLFKEALAVAQSDPELTAWLEENRTFDTAFSQKLASIQPPPGMKEEILAGMKATVLNAKWTPFPEYHYTAASKQRPSESINEGKLWKNPINWSIAAVLLVMAALAGSFSKPTNLEAKGELPNFFAAMAEHCDNEKIAFDFRTTDLEAIQTFLSVENKPTPTHLSKPLNSLSGVGCQGFNWEGSPVGLISLKNKKVFHLFVSELKNFPNAKPMHEPSLYQKGDYALAGWTRASKVYVLVVKGSSEDLEPLLL